MEQQERKTTDDVVDLLKETVLVSGFTLIEIHKAELREWSGRKCNPKFLTKVVKKFSKYLFNTGCAAVVTFDITSSKVVITFSVKMENQLDVSHGVTASNFEELAEASNWKWDISHICKDNGSKPIINMYYVDFEKCK